MPRDRASVIVPVADEDAAGLAWAGGVAREWADELSDSRQDIYSLSDGQPVDAAELNQA